MPKCVAAALTQPSACWAIGAMWVSCWHNGLDSMSLLFLTLSPCVRALDSSPPTRDHLDGAVAFAGLSSTCTAAVDGVKRSSSRGLCSAALVLR